ncbi:uncharacterized protein LOC143195781 [Rhynchophorus ferrugineus]|uniref:uncharacterized protein LOC143195781 n=1 Tax=Rhynchophorus ferrugineus TaxID=354439 RepID=UPI003FCED250
MYVAKNSPKELEFGHVCENPNEWEQRFEKLNLETLNRQGKVRWGDKDGGYGEHYWDYNHSGHDDEREEKEGQKSKNSSPSRDKRNPDDEVEFISSEAESSIRNARTPKHGGNYRKPHEIRSKRQPIKKNSENFRFDAMSDTVTDSKTGIQYQLKNKYAN